MMLVHRLLEESAAGQPDATALIEGARVASYAELDRQANRFAHVLLGAGVRRHDRVVIALENSIELAVAYFGTLKAGGVAVPLPTGPRSDRLATAAAECAPSAAVVDPATAREILEKQHATNLHDAHPLANVNALFVAGRRRNGPALPTSMRSFGEALRDGSDSAPGIRTIDIDLAAIIYTSGSTGEPRGVMLTHRNVVTNTRSIVSYLGLTEQDRVMCVLPFYYVYGLSLLHTHLAVGGSVVIDNRFAFPNVVLRAMQEHGVTGFAGVPSTFSLLLHRSELESTRLPALRYVTQAGGGMATARIQEWLARGPKVPFYVMYGATEASARLTYLSPDRLVDKPGSIGRPIPNVEIVVVTDEGTLAKPREVGELVARGSNIARGYWNNTEESAERFGPLGYRTGDLGYLDEEGFLFLVGRRHDMLKVGAHRVGAKEIEDVLFDFPGVLEAAVVGAPDDLLGQVPVAFVSMRDGLELDREAVETFCRGRLPAHKVPAQFIAKPELPKLGGVGKIDKRALTGAMRPDLQPDRL
jgi:long-chain acyl-CoA synthetase